MDRIRCSIKSATLWVCEVPHCEPTTADEFSNILSCLSLQLQPHNDSQDWKKSTLRPINSYLSFCYTCNLFRVMSTCSLPPPAWSCFFNLNHFLCSVAELLRRRFVEHGLLQGDARGFEPHLTIMKLSRASKLRSQVYKQAAASPPPGAVLEGKIKTLLSSDWL